MRLYFCSFVQIHHNGRRLSLVKHLIIVALATIQAEKTHKCYSVERLFQSKYPTTNVLLRLSSYLAYMENGLISIQNFRLFNQHTKGFLASLVRIRDFWVLRVQFFMFQLYPGGYKYFFGFGTGTQINNDTDYEMNKSVWSI